MAARAVKVLISSVFMMAVVTGNARSEESGTSSKSKVTSGLGLAAKVGTLGVSAEASIPVVPSSLNLRITGNYLDWSHDEVVDDIDFDLEVDFSSLGLLADWHPFKNGFRLSGGVLTGDNTIGLDAVLDDEITIGDTKYSPEALGTLSGDLDFDDVSPYLGLGFGNAASGEGRWSFAFDAGILFQNYDVSLSATGPATRLPGFAADLAAEEQEIEDDLDNYEIYPVLSFGMGYRF